MKSRDIVSGEEGVRKGCVRLLMAGKEWWRYYVADLDDEFSVLVGDFCSVRMRNFLKIKDLSGMGCDECSQQ